MVATAALGRLRKSDMGAAGQQQQQQPMQSPMFGYSPQPAYGASPYSPFAGMGIQPPMQSQGNAKGGYQPPPPPQPQMTAKGQTPGMQQAVSQQLQSTSAMGAPQAASPPPAQAAPQAPVSGLDILRNARTIPGAKVAPPGATMI